MRTLLFAMTLTLGFCFATLASCVSPGEYLSRATTPPTPGAPVPAVTLATKVPTVAGNPGDFSAWIEIAKAVGYIVLGASAKPVASKAVKSLKKAAA